MNTFQDTNIWYFLKIDTLVFAAMKYKMFQQMAVEWVDT